MYHETYSEYQADCAKCHKEVLNVIEHADIKEWDRYACVCSKCKVILCGKCAGDSDKPKCPDCGNDLLTFEDCSVYDFIAVVENDCQPFKGDEMNV